MIASSGEPMPATYVGPTVSPLNTCAGRGAVNVTIESTLAIILSDGRLRAHRIGVRAGRNIHRDHRDLARIQLAMLRRKARSLEA